MRTPVKLRFLGMSVDRVMRCIVFMKVVFEVYVVASVNVTVQYRMQSIGPSWTYQQSVIHSDLH
jgi:hypothetical protein